MAKKMVYSFGGGSGEGSAEMRNLLGGKGCNLAEMANIGIPVPAGFTITTEVCTDFYAQGGKYPEDLKGQVDAGVAHIEKIMGKKFGDTTNPLLVSVRSGARISMPGMMDTVLNLGLNDETVRGLIKSTGNARFAWDAYRRFIQMYSDVVLGVHVDHFEHLLEKTRHACKVKLDAQIPAEALEKLVPQYKALVQKELGKPFPSDPQEQLWGGIGAVFKSWNADRAIIYRRLNKIPEEWGTAVTVQSMVFGNMGDDSGTGVAFTRDPNIGERKFFGEYLLNAQGEDVVAGIRTPDPVSKLEEVMPAAYKQLTDIYLNLESHYKDMQDIEFTIERGRLWMLQTRSGKRAAAAAVRIAVEMVSEGLIDKNTAVLRVDPGSLDQLLHKQVDPKAKLDVIAKGLPASPGAATGQIVFNAEDAEALASKGKKVILVRLETSPEDIGGMAVSQAILTARGGMTSHAAVVARGMGKCCVVGCGELAVDVKKNIFRTAKGQTFKKGDVITVEGSTGRIIRGPVPLVDPKLDENFATLMSWADAARKLKVRTNADTPEDAAVARKFGAEGIGLCRTEHMFFGEKRIAWIREMILAQDEKGRRRALSKLLPMQRGDFEGIFKAMNGLPVTVRLLDPPLHEFLPHEAKEIKAMAKQMKVSPKAIEDRVQYLHEMNPMLGHRGCRLGITFPEIYEMQFQAILEAAVNMKAKGVDVHPEIMIPLILERQELAFFTAMLKTTAAKVFAAKKAEVDYMVGTMIEIPRAALLADEIAKEAEFFSFGTNDLTQMTLGLSRDDAGKFLPAYVEKKLFKDDPFQSLDQNGVGKLMEMGVKLGRSTRNELKCGICGEHGGDPASVIFCHKVGLNYVSCSPYRVPIARLAAAHASLKK